MVDVYRRETDIGIDAYNLAANKKIVVTTL